MPVLNSVHIYILINSSHPVSEIRDIFLEEFELHKQKYGPLRLAFPTF